MFIEVLCLLLTDVMFLLLHCELHNNAEHIAVSHVTQSHYKRRHLEQVLYYILQEANELE